MQGLNGLGALAVFVPACGSASPTAAISPSPTPRPTIATPTASPSPRPSTAPQPTPPPQVTCHNGASTGPMLLMSATWTAIQLLYDGTDPARPRLLCTAIKTPPP